MTKGIEKNVVLMVIASAAIIAAQANSGQLYKCKTGDAITYQDKPCQGTGAAIKGADKIDPAEVNASRLREARQQIAFQQMQRERERQQIHNQLLASQNELLNTLDSAKRQRDQRMQADQVNRCKTLSALANSAEQRERQNRNYNTSQMAQSARGRYMNECQ